MLADSNDATVRSLDWIDLRPPAAALESIDICRGAGSGSVSPNTLIAEVIDEKLARDRLGCAQRDGGEHA
jgi:hypothetical protein